ncbi:hypothetical protein QTQ03_02040 [Micromonospora sp. WMMA1363]|uniref:hypothetical protein n=1 Tax=Micromonospora sp. WMMA1363 TaxID=3053985 RepID=UPI00259CC46A|nr:hypothetical protein [Micromonospora sp. WMMA1363]MDM4718430.1 hypothetical protein [Micromonospora sp. WMMA1363]
MKVAFKGKDGRRASVAVDRYSNNLPPVAYASDEAFRNHVTSAALSSVIGSPKYGPDWVEDYQVIDIPDIHRS